MEIYLYYINEDPIGHVRLNYSEDMVSISYDVVQKYRGQGFEKLIIHDIERKIIENHDSIVSIVTKIKTDNIASQKIFEDNNYEQISAESDIYVYSKSINSSSYLQNITKHIITRVERKIVLLLTNNRNALKLYDMLSEMGEPVEIYSDILSADMLIQMKPAIIVSYNYKHIIRENIISLMENKIINLHTSYLPWNKGSDPNFWSFIDNTPKGVAIHKVDTHLDTGNLLYQKEIIFDENIETFRTSYKKLNDEIVSLLCENWEHIKNGITTPAMQNIGGSYHKRSDFNEFTSKYPINWEENISNYKKKYNLP